MRIVAFDRVDSADWDEAVDASDESWLFHRAEWVAVETAYFVRRNLSFALTEENGRVLAVLPLYFSDATNGTTFAERLIHSGIHRQAGLAVRRDVAPSLVEILRRAAIARIDTLSELYGADRIQLGIHNLAPKFRGDRDEAGFFWCDGAGYEAGIDYGPQGMRPLPGRSTLEADQIVDLTREETAIFDGFIPACRRAIRKAEKAGLRFEWALPATALDRYWALALKSAARTGEVLPPRAYYESLFARLGAVGRLVVCFAKSGAMDAAGLILLADRDCASYLAGVSDTDYLQLRPNDYIHWSAMRDLRHRGYVAYRFGPIFPEAPEDWPIARVSAFKAKFGARSVPIASASKFLSTPAAADAAAKAHYAAFGQRAFPGATASSSRPSLGAALVAHLLRVVGLEAHANVREGPVIVVDAATPGWESAMRGASTRRATVVLNAKQALGSLFGRSTAGVFEPSTPLAPAAGGKALRSFHPAWPLDVASADAIVTAPGDVPVWQWISDPCVGSLLLIGSDLAGDLALIRQGAPAAAALRPATALWGIDGERPNYLFENQLDPVDPFDRLADRWIWTLRSALVGRGGVAVRPVLPFDAPGAVIVTGDDDQASIDAYKGQAQRLGRLPTTYFLHPLARIDRRTMARVAHDRAVEWELHPDALDAPDRYAERLSDQCAWYTAFMGRKPRMLRNHGFLNDGYWGHAAAWLDNGIVGSSNLPGLDGRILNGSLLPGRLALGGELTCHWSVLTAFGDGVYFVHAWDAAKAFDAVLEAGRRIVESGIPGMLVLNLHPANHDSAASMHEAAHALVKELGFAAMNLGGALAWFDRADSVAPAAIPAGTIAPYSRTRQRTGPMRWIRSALAALLGAGADTTSRDGNAR